MLALLRATLGPDVALYFLMGADSLVDLPNWREPEGILRQAQLVVMDRPGYVPDLASLAERLPGLKERLTVLPMPLVGIAASDIERRVREGRPIRYQVPEAVEAYIRDHGLYLAAEVSGAG